MFKKIYLCGVLVRIVEVDGIDKENNALNLEKPNWIF